MENDRLVLYLMDNEQPPTGYVEVCRTRGWEVGRGGEIRRVVAWADPVQVDVKNGLVISSIKAAANIQDERRYKAHAEGRYVGFSDGSMMRDSQGSVR